MPYLERDGNDIHYQTWEPTSSTRWVTLINGYSRPLNDFGPLAKKLVDKGCSVLSLDNRGAGATHFKGDFSLDDMASDVAALWHHLGISSSVLLGISMGGVIATTLAARNPSAVEKFILISAPIDSTFLNTARDHATLTPEARALDFRRYFSKGYAERNALFVTGFTRQMERYFQDARIIRGARAQRVATAEFDLAPLLASLKMPSLILHGTEDNIVPFRSADILNELLPNARLIPYVAAGHLLLVEHSSRMLGDILEFLSQ